ncbi:hypothetical protein RP20_CCG026464 [Aedes albopictus]|nr:hypothetical protein RP20_CCG026464 [Aedes albopictus]
MQDPPKHCKKCTRPDEAENMVGCDGCEAWEHYGCAGVSGSIAGSNRSWMCEDCRRQALATTGAGSTVSAYTSASSKKSRQAQLRLELLEQQKQVRIKRLEEEEQYLKDKFEILMQLEEEDDMASNRSRVSTSSKRDRLQKWLEQGETVVPEGDIAAERGAVRKNVGFEATQASASGRSLTAPAFETQLVSGKLEKQASDVREPDFSTPNPMKTISTMTTDVNRADRMHVLDNVVVRPRTQQFERIPPKSELDSARDYSRIGKHENPLSSRMHPRLPYPHSSEQLEIPSEMNSTSRTVHSSHQSRIEESRIHRPDSIHFGPTASQLAARQVMPRDLPIFAGDPEDWPIFYSSFQNSTEVCGYSDAENLSRLQRCLRGTALESVRSRLLLPSSVDSVIATLRMLFGRPEILINALLKRVRSSPAPKADNLKSIVDYGLAVQNLIDHMIVSQQQDHLNNPLLLNELVEKLPTNFKLQWSSFKQEQSNVNLATFNNFVSNLVFLASDLLVTSDSYQANLKGNRPEKQKEKLFVHAQEPVSAYDEEERKSEMCAPDRSTNGCSYCDETSHHISNCQSFKSLPVDARWKSVRSKNLCRTCLVPHRRWPCRSKKECGLEGCRARHHQLLHAQHMEQTSPAANDVVQAHQNHHQSQSFSLFRYVPVKLSGNGRVVNTFAFLDEGSSSTLLEAEIAEQLGMDGPSSSLWLSWTGNICREEKGSKCISLTISGGNSEKSYTIDNVLTVDELHLPQQSFDYESLVEQYPHLVGLPLQSYSGITPRMIIGLEHVRLLTALKMREGNGGPVVVKTRLGWCAFGKESDGRHLTEQLNLHFHEAMSNQALHDIMKGYFAVEESAVSSKPEAEDDRRAVHILEQTTIRHGNRYETGLLWKIENPVLPDSLPMARSRLKSLEKRLERDPELGSNVQRLIESYVAKGYAHKATTEELQNTDPRHVWYLPLGVVVSPKKPGKIRLIWDAAAKVQGVSFNDLLLKGPDLLVSLVAVMLRFRERSIAVCGDICEMFHQIRIRSTDKQYQRFLWRSDPAGTIEVYIMDVATFGATCSPCSAQFIKNKNAQEHAVLFPRAATAIIENHYVDDFLDSTDTVEEAAQLVDQVKSIHAAAGFEIRKFRSNAPEVLEAIGEPEAFSEKPITSDKQAETERVLGLVWDPVEDIFTFDVSCLRNQRLLNTCVAPTKRQVLQLLMRLFDPLGFISHYTIHGKILMQEIWRSGTNWDDPIADNLLDMWYRWLELLALIGDVQVPRCYFRDLPSNSLCELQVHVFVDAGESAYACIGYVRIVCSGETRCSLVASKTKVAPLKPLSVPRLELQAAMIGARLMQTICSSLTLPISKRYLWTDSSTVLAWLRSDSRRYHQFVGFRVGEILSLSSVEEWRYVPSSQNPADEATKWVSGPTFDQHNRWFSGPDFLVRNDEEWPIETSNSRQNTTSEELRSIFLHSCNVTEQVIEASRFSNWNRLVRATAYVLRAIRIMRRKIPSGEEKSLLQSSEIQEAESTLLRQAQIQAYPDEIATMMKHATIGKASPLYRLNPFLDEDGLIRMGSRIAAAPEASYSAKYPVILPKQHAITELITDSFHRRLLHGNNETVHNEMRQMFYVTGLRNLIKKVSRNCQRCKVKNATPRPPMMAPLPKVRLTPFVRAFTFVGVDYFGPIEVKVGRSVVKRWVSLFTCLTVRAIHLEVTHSLSTQSCVLAFRRFIARRGAPREVYSDNGTNFVGANRQLTEEQIQIQQVNRECASTFTSANTTWHFNVPAAPHMGGPWERLVRSVKTAMKVISDSTQHPSDEILETILLEAEGVINSRPLTYVPLDDADDEALTPNHFLLYGSSGVKQPETIPVEGNVGLRDGYKQTQKIVDKFWQRWVHEYLPMLTRRTKWFEKVKPIEPGDLVIVIDEKTRNSWIRGRVIETTSGSDNQVRRARVLTANGIISRPAVKLAVLDVKPRGLDNSDDPSGTGSAHGPGDVAELAGHT